MAGIDQFTQRARRVLIFAHKEAAMNHSVQIGTEHLLLGLIQAQGSTSAKVLESLDVTADRVREINAAMGPDESPIEITGSSREVLSADVQDVLRRAVQRAVEANDNYISTEHLLMSLIDTPNSRAVRILERMGLDNARIQDQLRSTLESGTNSVQQEQQAPPPPELSDVSVGRQQPGAKSSRKESPLMDQLATDLTAKAAAGKLDPVVGRQNEIERVIQILARRTKNKDSLKSG